MPDYLDELTKEIIQDSIEEKLKNNSTDFLDSNELTFLEKLNEKRLVDYIRNVPGIDINGTLDMSERLAQYRKGETPKTMEDIQKTLNILENWEKDVSLSDYERRNIGNVRRRFSNYASAIGLAPTEFDMEWANRYLAFHNKGFLDRIFDVADNPSLEVSLPENSLNIARRINSSGAPLIKALCDMYRVTPNEFIAALVAENPNLNPDDLSGEVLGRKIALLAKGKRYAGKGAPASKAYSLYENYNARKVTPYGATAGALLDYYNKHYVPGPLDVLAETSPSLLDKINNLDMSEESPDSLVQLDESEIKSLMDFYINLYDRHRLDSNWLKELKNAIYPENGTDRPFNIVLNHSKSKIKNVGAAFIPRNGVDQLDNPRIEFYVPSSSISFNSNESLAKLVHELVHAYQYFVMSLPFPNENKDPGIEVLPFTKQFELEKILNVSNNPFVRNYFEEIDKTSKDESERISRKAKGLYERLGYNQEKHYFLPDDF